jgi:hypothetical protein
MGDGSLAPLANLTGLQHLDIDIVPPHITHWQSLVLADPEPADLAAAEVAAGKRLSSGALSQLSQLTHFSISGYLALKHEFLQSLSTLTDLQQLSSRTCKSLYLLAASVPSISSLQHFTDLLRLTVLDLDVC